MNVARMRHNQLTHIFEFGGILPSLLPVGPKASSGGIESDRLPPRRTVKRKGMKKTGMLSVQPAPHRAYGARLRLAALTRLEALVPPWNDCTVVNLDLEHIAFQPCGLVKCDSCCSNFSLILDAHLVTLVALVAFTDDDICASKEANVTER